MLCIVNSIVLLTNGINFAVQAVLLVTIGAWADYGTWRCAGATVGPSIGAEWTPTVQKQTKYLDFVYHSVAGRLVCMAWRSRPIAMASRRRSVYAWLYVLSFFPPTISCISVPVISCQVVTISTSQSTC